MKTIIIFLFCYSLAFAQYNTLPYTLPLNGWERIEKSCEICGKEICEYVEEKEISGAYWDDGIYSFPSNPNYNLSDEEKIFNLGFSRQIQICEECYNKYSGEMTKYIEEQWDDYVGDILDDNICKREKQAELKKQKELDALQKQIDDLKKKKRNLELGITEQPEMDGWKTWGGNMGSTVFILDSLTNASWIADTVKVSEWSPDVK